VVAGPKGWAAYGAIDPGERTKALDDLGFSRQLVFTTFAGSQFLPSPDPDVKYGGARALNRAMADFCRADKRLIGVGVVPLDDPQRALAEVDAAIAAGVGAIWVPAAPAGDVSPGHPDLDPVWRRLAEAGVPFMLHVGAASPTLPPAYHKNGHPRPKDWLGGGENLRAKDYFALSFAPQNFLASLALDGVFDRFPALRGGVIELGAGWVPDFLRRLDQAWKGWRKTDPVVASLSMPPSELVRRAVRFTPYATEDAGTIIREGGPELFLFSSDYPHPEGTRNPIERFEGTFAGFDEDTKDRFYRRNFEDMFAGA
jgi:predicted TIM-barrel fold metal-dependent hydrolase